ncbi:MAG: DEAD/DEAH box helicase [Desulfobacterales bacterium]|nr:DEAD/DEAH box helicase [Desulfobacterales bacterium]
MKRRPYHPRSRPRQPNGKWSAIPKIQPRADARLKSVFDEIGVPQAAPFLPDPFQIEAVSCIPQADCLVTAPTGSGKTWIAEQTMERTLRQGGRAWYASPLKALSNAKYRDFAALFGSENLGILTGDRKENPDAPIIVGTTEILRNQLYDAMGQGETLAADLVILDEAHFLGDPDRGVVWEEIMIYLPPRIPLLMLSATIGNADEIAQWLSDLRGRPCRVVKETLRPVPLSPIFLHPDGTLMPLTDPSPQKPSRLYKKVGDYVRSSSPPLMAPPGRLPPFGQILKILHRFDLLPAIFFLKSRADCDRALDLCLNALPWQTGQQKRLADKVAQLAEQHPHIASHRQRQHIETLAVGAHHSGQLPAWKMVLESLMTEGLLHAIFATSTVAAGVNFPARTVIFFNSDRFNGTGFAPLTSTELHQMTGRAGRRGMDRIGFAVVVPGKFMDVPMAAKLFSTPAGAVDSQIRINFSMVLNLLMSHSPEQVEDLLSRSLAAFQITRHRKRGQTGRLSGERFLSLDFQRHLDFLQNHQYVSMDGKLTEDGLWASQLRVDEPLMIAEGFRRGVLPDSDPSLLAGIIAAFVNEKELADTADKRIIPTRLQAAFKNVVKKLRPFAREMIDAEFQVRPLYFRAAVTVFLWAEGMDWSDVHRLSEMEEGSLAMLILRTADNLRHIRALGNVFPSAAETAARAIESIVREPVLPTD